MNAPGIARTIRFGAVAALGLAIAAFLLFGSVTVGVGSLTGIRERVAVIVISANAAMAEVGIAGAWRAVAWSGAAVAILATLALIWYASWADDERE